MLGADYRQSCTDLHPTPVHNLPWEMHSRVPHREILPRLGWRYTGNRCTPGNNRVCPLLSGEKNRKEKNSGVGLEVRARVKRHNVSLGRIQRPPEYAFPSS